jgi:hypothetical protein
MIKKIILYSLIFINSCYSFITPIPNLKNSLILSSNINKQHKDIFINKKINSIMNCKKNNFNMDEYKIFLLMYIIICIIKNFIICLSTIKFIDYFF